MSRNLNRKCGRFDHLGEEIEKKWLAQAIILIFLFALWWTIFRDATSLPVVESSVTTGESYLVKPDGTRVPFDPETYRGRYEEYKVK